MFVFSFVSILNFTTVNKILFFCCVSAGRRRLFNVKKHVFWSWNVAAGAFFLLRNCVFGAGTLPQAFFLLEKRVFGVGTLPQAPFFIKICNFTTGHLLNFGSSYIYIYIYIYTQLLKSSSQNCILGSTFKEELLLRSLLLRRSYF